MLVKRCYNQIVAYRRVHLARGGSPPNKNSKGRKYVFAPPILTKDTWHFLISPPNNFIQQYNYKNSPPPS